MPNEINLLNGKSIQESQDVACKQRIGVMGGMKGPAMIALIGQNYTKMTR
jgi:hypothetical protein